MTRGADAALSASAFLTAGYSKMRQTAKYGGDVRYIRHNLEHNEVIVIEEKQHWAVFIKPALAALVGMCWLSLPAITPLRTLPFCGALVWFAATWLSRQLSELAVTDRRVALRNGLLVDVFPLNTVTGVYVSQGFLGRLLNYGSMRIKSVSIGGNGKKYTYIRDPFAVQKALLDRMRQDAAAPSVVVHVAAPAPPAPDAVEPAPPPPMSAEKQILALAEKFPIMNLRRILAETPLESDEAEAAVKKLIQKGIGKEIVDGEGRVIWDFSSF